MNVLRMIAKFFETILALIGIFIGGLILLGIIGYSLFGKNEGECAQEPQLPICDIITEEHKQFLSNIENNLKVSPIPELDKNILIYWSNDSFGSYPKEINFPFIYLKKSGGLWLRRKNGLGDIYLGKETPKGFIYQETKKSVQPPPKMRDYEEWLIELVDENKKPIYQQDVHFITWLNVHSEWANSLIIPNNFYKVKEYLVEHLQKNDLFGVNDLKPRIKNEDNLIFGNKICPPLPNSSNIFEWHFKTGKYKIQFPDDNEYWTICGENHILLLIKKGNRLYVQLFDNESPFNYSSLFEDSMGYIKSKQLSDFKSFEFKEVKYYEKSDKDKKIYSRFFLYLFDENHQVIADSFEDYWHEEVKE